MGRLQIVWRRHTNKIPSLSHELVRRLAASKFIFLVILLFSFPLIFPPSSESPTLTICHIPRVLRHESRFGFARGACSWHVYFSILKHLGCTSFLLLFGAAAAAEQDSDLKLGGKMGMAYSEIPSPTKYYKQVGERERERGRDKWGGKCTILFVGLCVISCVATRLWDTMAKRAKSVWKNIKNAASCVVVYLLTYLTYLPDQSSCVAWTSLHAMGFQD